MSSSLRVLKPSLIMEVRLEEESKGISSRPTIQMGDVRIILRHFCTTHLILPFRARKERRRRAVVRVLETETVSRTEIETEWASETRCLFGMVVSDSERIQRLKMTSLCCIWWVGVLWLSERAEWSSLMKDCLHTPQALLKQATCAEHVLLGAERIARDKLAWLEWNSSMCPRSKLSKGCAHAVMLEEPNDRTSLHDEEYDSRKRLWNKYSRSTRIAVAQWFEFEEFMVRQAFEMKVVTYFVNKQRELHVQAPPPPTL